MSNLPELSFKVTSKISVIIKATDQNVDLNEPLIAINWFSTKAEWVYHLYNLLAARSVRKIGGRAIFKAKVTEVILDEDNRKRDLLLMVRYPDAQSFSKLLQSTYFKVVSILRIISVSKFTFGFTHKIDAIANSENEDGLFYAIHHFKSKGDASTNLQIIKNLLPENVMIKYAGNTVAKLNSRNQNKDITIVPCLMDGLYIFQSSEKSSLYSFLTSLSYKEVLENLHSSHISLLKRV